MQEVDASVGLEQASSRLPGTEVPRCCVEGPDQGGGGECGFHSEASGSPRPLFWGGGCPPLVPAPSACAEVLVLDVLLRFRPLILLPAAPGSYTRAAVDDDVRLPAQQPDLLRAAPSA